MTHATTRIIREEHAALSAMLRSIPLLLAQHQRHATLPDFAALRAMLSMSMLFYVDEFPEQRRQRKETELLFPLPAPAHRAGAGSARPSGRRSRQR